MSAPIRLTVYGTAKPQGSKSAFVNRATGRAVMRESSSTSGHVAWKAWRDAVADAARAWQADHNAALLDESLQVEITFHFAKPKSLPRWKLWASSADDIDKLVRAVNDSLTGTLLVNDSRVVRLVAEKLYTLDAPRAEIIITPLGDIERAGTTGPLAERSA